MLQTGDRNDVSAAFAPGASRDTSGGGSSASSSRTPTLPAPAVTWSARGAAATKTASGAGVCARRA